MQAFSSHDIFQTLYQQIMLLELKPGSTLRENALCEQFGVSRTPVPRTAGPAENPQRCFAPPGGPTPPGPADVL